MEAPAGTPQAAPAATTQRPRPAGRCQIPIKRIQSAKVRSVTFLKRKKGLMKKATELSVLCHSDIALIVFSPTGKLIVYSNKSVDGIYDRYKNHNGPIEVVSNANYQGGLPSADAEPSSTDDELQVAASSLNSATSALQQTPILTKPTRPVVPIATRGGFKPTTLSASKRPSSAVELSPAVKPAKRPSFLVESLGECASSGKLRPMTPGMQRLAAHPTNHQPPVLSGGAESFCVPVQWTPHPACDWQRGVTSYSFPSRASLAMCPPRRLMSFAAGAPKHGMSCAQPHMPLASQMPHGAQVPPGATHSAGPHYCDYQPQVHHAHHEFCANAPTPTLIRCDMQPARCSSSGYNTAVAVDHPTWPAHHYASSSSLACNPYKMCMQSMDDMSYHRTPSSFTEAQAGGPDKAANRLR